MWLLGLLADAQPVFGWDLWLLFVWAQEEEEQCMEPEGCWCELRVR